MLRLLFTNCVPILTYACEVKALNGREMMSYDVALNDCIRKIFSYNRWESIRSLRKEFGYDSVSELFTKRTASFYRAIKLTGNPVLKHLSSIELNL